MNPLRVAGRLEGRRRLGVLDRQRRRAAELDSAQRAEQARQAMQAAHDQVAEQFRAGDLDEVGFIGQFRSAIDDERQRALKGADPAFAPMIERALVGAEREVQRKAAGTVVAVTKDRRKAKRDSRLELGDDGELVELVNEGMAEAELREQLRQSAGR